MNTEAETSSATKVPLLVQDKRNPLSIRVQRECIEALRLGLDFHSLRENTIWCYLDISGQLRDTRKTLTLKGFHSPKIAVIYDAARDVTLIDELPIKSVMTWVDEIHQPITNALALTKHYQGDPY